MNLNINLASLSFLILDMALYTVALELAKDLGYMHTSLGIALVYLTVALTLTAKTIALESVLKGKSLSVFRTNTKN